MQGPKSRLQQAWGNIPLASLRELARSMPQRLKRYTEQGGALWILIFQQWSKETMHIKLENFH